MDFKSRRLSCSGDLRTTDQKVRGLSPFGGATSMAYELRKHGHAWSKIGPLWTTGAPGLLACAARPRTRSPRGAGWPDRHRAATVGCPIHARLAALVDRRGRGAGRTAVRDGGGPPAGVVRHGRGGLGDGR